MKKEAINGWEGSRECSEQKQRTKKADGEVYFAIVAFEGRLVESLCIAQCVGKALAVELILNCSAPALFRQWRQELNYETIGRFAKKHDRD